MLVVVGVCAFLGRAQADAPKEPPSRPAPPTDAVGDEGHGTRVLPRSPANGDEPPPGEAGDRGPGFGRRPFGRERPRLDYDRLSEEEKAQLEAFLQKHFPDRFEELSRLDETAPRLFSRAINQMLPQMLRLMHMEQDDPEQFPVRLEEVKASFQLRGAMRRLRESTDSGERDRLLAEVREMLIRRFDLRQQMHRADIHKLERRLGEAKTGLEQRAADKEKIIARELEEVSSGRMPPNGPPDGPMREGPPPEGRPGGRAPRLP